MFNAVVKNFFNSSPAASPDDKKIQAFRGELDSVSRNSKNNVVKFERPNSKNNVVKFERPTDSQRFTNISPSSGFDNIKKTALKQGLHPETFFSQDGLMTCFLGAGADYLNTSGRKALSIFDQSFNPRAASLTENESSNNFLSRIFTGFLGFLKNDSSASISSISPLESFYKKSQNAADIDNLGEPWEHFKKALSTDHYQILPIYNSLSKDFLDPVAYAVFEKLDLGETKSSLFKQLAAGSQINLKDIKNHKVSFLDKVITNGFDPNLDMNQLQRFAVNAFMKNQSRDTLLMVPWRADPVEKLSLDILKGVNHIGFTRINGNIEITPRHVIEGREYPSLKTTSIFTKSPQILPVSELKGLVLLQTLSELSAGPVMRLSGTAAINQVKSLVDDSFRNIDRERQGSSDLSWNPFKLLAGFWKH